MNQYYTEYFATVGLCFILYLYCCATKRLMVTPIHFIGFMGPSIIPGLNAIFCILVMSSIIRDTLEAIKFKETVSKWRKLSSDFNIFR